MNNYSYTQEFMLCALSPKGTLSSINMDACACIIGGGLLELLQCGALEQDSKKKLAVQKGLPPEKEYLSPLYSMLSESKPITAADVAQKYLFCFSGKQMQTLVCSLGDSLAEGGSVTSQKKDGLLGEKVFYLPKEEAVSRVIEKIRAEFLEDGELSEETIILGTLLKLSGLLNRYFSKYEAKKLKERIKSIQSDPSYKLVNNMIESIEVLLTAIIATTTAH